MIESKPAKEAEIFRSVTEETVGPMVEKYMALRITGVDDKSGIAAVRAARQDVRKARTTVDRERAAAKRYYDEEGNKIQAAAKRIWALIEPVEEYLVKQLDYVDAENERIANEQFKKNEAVRLENQREADRIERERQSLAEEHRVREAMELAEQQERQRLVAAEAKRSEDEKMIAALKPHKEKIAAYRDALLAVPMPELPKKHSGATGIMQGVRNMITDHLTRLVDGMEKV